jgi:hypothetical protein
VRRQGTVREDEADRMALLRLDFAAGEPSIRAADVHERLGL